MSSQPTTGVPFTGSLLRRWAVNGVAGACALLLGLATGEWVCSPFLDSPRSPVAAWPSLALPRVGGPEVSAWIPTLLPVVCNLVVLSLFAAVLVPVLRRRDRRRDDSRRDRMGWPAQRGASFHASPGDRDAASRLPPSRPAVLTGRELRLEPESDARRAEQDRWEKEKDDMLRKVFEENLSLRS